MSNDNFHIRLGEKEDVKLLQKINAEAMVNNVKWDKYFVRDWSNTIEAGKYFSEILNDKDKCCLIVEIDGVAVGYLNGGIRDESYRKGKFGEIENVAVVPKYQGQGIGSGLVEMFKQWCGKREAKRVVVSSYVKNERAVEFYKMLGFVPLDISLEAEIS